MAVTLRPATLEDAPTLRDWRNDTATRENSLERTEVSAEEHLRWLTATLANPGRRLFIAEGPEGPVGTARLDFTANGRAGEMSLEWTPSAEVSLTVAPASRAHGWGSTILHALVAEARGLGRTRLDAHIRNTNAASLRAFIGAGFLPYTVDAGGVVWLTRRLS